jgi:hypothetical protein
MASAVRTIRLAWNNVDLDAGSVSARLTQAAIEPAHAVEF